MKGLIIKKLTKFEDKRGWLSEIFRSDEAEYAPVMSYVSMTNPGMYRGPHEHKKQSDCFAFAGPGNFELHLWDNRENSPTKGEYVKIEVGENNPTLAIVPPGVVHGYKCVSETPGYCVNFPDKLYKGRSKKEEVDEIRWEKDPNSPFKII
ncbi:MAG: dTDP-4-dehydrorhamnose 3,5-epimerase family protein [Patescibacteria group bacterium]